MTRPPKSIPPARDRLQSRLLVGSVAPILVILCAIQIGTFLSRPEHRPYALESIAISAAFAFAAWLLKAATSASAAIGGVLCFLLTDCSASNPPSPLHSGLVPLVLLFALTFLATHCGRTRKEARGVSEPRTGRHTSQVLANLGIAALIAAFSRTPTQTSIFALGTCLAALAEATADTVSSEIGQVFGGAPFLLTTFRRVPLGTDGALSLAGTVAGIAGAAIVAIAGAPALGISLAECFLAFVAAVAGLFFDSLLGATLERRGYLGNDLVNFASTLFAALLALAEQRFRLH